MDSVSLSPLLLPHGKQGADAAGCRFQLHQLFQMGGITWGTRNANNIRHDEMTPYPDRSRRQEERLACCCSGGRRVGEGHKALPDCSLVFTKLFVREPLGL